MRGYSTDLTDDQWHAIEALIPSAKSGGRPRSTSPRRTIDGILYLVRTGCQWRQLPSDFPPWPTVYRYFALWQRTGVLRDIQRAIYHLTRFLADRAQSPSAIVVDSQSVKTAKAGGPRGFDGGKRVKGRKRHIVVDSQGLLIDVAVTPANVHDTKGVQKALRKAMSWVGGQPKVLFADKGYQGRKFANWTQEHVGATVTVSENPAMAAKRFVPVRKRWVVERTFAWFGDYRRLDKDHERRTTHSIAMIRWAMLSLMLRRLTV